jgi:hypothetical protein
MQKQHALIIADPLISPAELEYLIIKANRLGLENKKILGVWQEKDEEGKHVFLGISDCQQNPSP